MDLLCSIAIRNAATIPIPPSVVIYNNAIYNIFDNNQASHILQQIAHNNQSLTNLIFYTDGLVCNISTERCKMGIGWVQIENETITNCFSAAITLWFHLTKQSLLQFFLRLAHAHSLATLLFIQTLNLL